MLDFPVGGQRYWEPTVKAKEQEPKDFLKYFKPLSGKLEEGESPPPGAIKAPDFMKQYFPDVDYYMYQQPKVLDLGAFF